MRSAISQTLTLLSVLTATLAATGCGPCEDGSYPNKNTCVCESGEVVDKECNAGAGGAAGVSSGEGGSGAVSGNGGSGGTGGSGAVSGNGGNSGGGGAGATSGNGGSGGGGGAGEGGGGAGSGGSAGTNEPVIVYEQEFEAPGSFDPGEWSIDNTNGARVGSHAIHPPMLIAGDSGVDMALDCGGAAHTQLAFELLHPLRGSDVTLELLVDDQHRTYLSGNNYYEWRHFIFNVPRGAHSYTFRVATNEDVAPAFVIDSVVCTDVEPAATPNQRIDFDDAFIPTETTGDWVTDNVTATHEGQAAIHPPTLIAGDTDVDMVLDCGDVTHTQLSFRMLHPERGQPVTLELLIDGEHRTYLWGDNYYEWRHFIFNVPEGAHTYTFRVAAESDSPVPFVIDTIACTQTPPAATPNQRIDFDDGFLPTEVTGDWLVDNVTATQDGQAAIHPPTLIGGQADVDMNLDCGDVEHTQLSFRMLHPRRGQPVTLELLIDGQLRTTLAGDNYYEWRTFVINVPPAAHNYTFRASATVDSPVPFVIDTIACTNTDPVAAPNQRIDFDDGFVPVEVSGDWLVDNVMPTHEGEASAHPPELSAGATEMDLVVACGVTHTQLSFRMLHPRRNQPPTLELLVDGAPRTGLVADNYYEWKLFTFDVSPGPHTYTFRAASSVESLVPFVVDSIACANP